MAEAEVDLFGVFKFAVDEFTGAGDFVGLVCAHEEVEVELMGSLVIGWTIIG